MSLEGLDLTDEEQVAFCVAEDVEGLFSPCIVFQLKDKSGKLGQFVFESDRRTKKAEQAQAVLERLSDYFDEDKIAFVKDYDKNLN